MGAPAPIEQVAREAVPIFREIARSIAERQAREAAEAKGATEDRGAGS